MTIEQYIINHHEEMEKVRNASWLCRLFQENALNAEEKQNVLRDLHNEIKKSRQQTSVN